MYFQFGTPLRLHEIDKTPDLKRLRREITIAIIDDDHFRFKEQLETNGYRVQELGPDISAVEQLEAYSVVACDIRGVAPKFGSDQEGAHLISEVRKIYPDKYLIAYTGSGYDARLNNKVSSADSSLNKDVPFDFWHSELEKAIKSMGNPKVRWMRFRKALAEDGIDAWDLFNLEQAFIRSIIDNDPNAVRNRKLISGMTESQSHLVEKLAQVVVPSLLGMVFGN